MRIRTMLAGLTVLAFGMSLADAGAAHATATGGCEATTLLTFSPPLTTVTQTGTGTLTNWYTCVNAQGTVVRQGTNGFTTTYAGTCTSATLTYANWSATLLAGSIAIETDNTGLAVGMSVLNPDQVCNEASAAGPGFSASALAPDAAY